MAAVQVCLVESFHGGSHRAWAEGYAASSSHEVTVLTLPAENWRWRMRGGAVALADQVNSRTSGGWRPDVVLVSDMLDLGLFRSLTRPLWGSPPMVLYFHENQIMYPSQQGTDPGFGFINWASCLAADAVWFNSEFHRTGFLDHLPGLLARFPDGPHDVRSELIRDKSMVMPVGVDLGPFPVHHRASRIPLVLWNHRWEHDKRPSAFVGAITRLADEGFEFEVALLGQEPIGGDPARDDLERRLGGRLIWSGFADRGRYEEIVRSADLVVSVADHEFFGIAVVEAVAAGACPVLPNRLSYPELLPPEHHDDALYPAGGLIDRLRTRLGDLDATRAVGRRAAVSVRRFDWAVIGPRYDREIGRVGPRDISL